MIALSKIVLICKSTHFRAIQNAKSKWTSIRINSPSNPWFSVFPQIGSELFQIKCRWIYINIYRIYILFLFQLGLILTTKLLIPNSKCSHISPQIFFFLLVNPIDIPSNKNKYAALNPPNIVTSQNNSATEAKPNNVIPENILVEIVKIPVIEI